MKKVKKEAGDQELLSLVNNIASLINETKQMLSGESSEEVKEDLTQTGLETDTEGEVKMNDEDKEDEIEKEDAENEEVEKEDDDEEDDDESKVVKMLKKAIEQTPTDAATANDSSEERLEDPLPESTEDGIEEVAKAIVRVLRKQKPTAKKSNSAGLLKQLVVLVKSQNERISENEKAMLNVIKGLGIADNVIKPHREEIQEVRKGLNDSTDNQKALDYIMSALGKKVEKEDDYSDNITKVRKTLANKNFLSNLIVKK